MSRCNEIKTSLKVSNATAPKFTLSAAVFEHPGTRNVQFSAQSSVCQLGTGYNIIIVVLLVLNTSAVL